MKKKLPEKLYISRHTSIGDDYVGFCTPTNLVKKDKQESVAVYEYKGMIEVINETRIEGDTDD